MVNCRSFLLAISAVRHAFLEQSKTAPGFLNIALAVVRLSIWSQITWVVSCIGRTESTSAKVLLGVHVVGLTEAYLSLLPIPTVMLDCL